MKSKMHGSRSTFPKVNNSVILGYRDTLTALSIAPDGLVLVGDAFSFLDPVFSTGVYLALSSGEMAADTINAILQMTVYLQRISLLTMEANSVIPLRRCVKLCTPSTTRTSAWKTNSWDMELRGPSQTASLATWQIRTSQNCSRPWLNSLIYLRPLAMAMFSQPSP